MAVLLSVDILGSYGVDSNRPCGGTFFRGPRVGRVPISFKNWSDEVAIELEEGWFDTWVNGK